MLLSYELFLTHVYNFHKSFCKGEGEEGKGRQIQFTPAEPLARWAGMGGEGKEKQAPEQREWDVEQAASEAHRWSSEGQAEVQARAHRQGHAPTEGSEAPVTGI